jgi:hypothetical protein
MHLQRDAGASPLECGIAGMTRLAISSGTVVAQLRELAMELCLRPEADEPPAAPPEPGCVAAAAAAAARSASAPASADSSDGGAPGGSDGGAPGGSDGSGAAGGARRGDSDECNSGQVRVRTHQAPAVRELHAALQIFTI